MASASATVRVDKATSELLIGPDWTMNMEICDSINSDQWQAKEVVKAVKKRLQNKNPRVQFLALTLLETMIKNCGDFVHFQVVERSILEEMVKIVRKKTDMQVRDKILVLLDSWQEAFGGPGGRYPQYFYAYADLKRSGVEFPQRSAESTLIFTPPLSHPIPIHGHPQAGYGMPNNSTTRLDEAMASEMANLSLVDLERIRGVMELLGDMLQAVNPNDRGAVKDEIIVDLVSQCRSNQKKLMQLVNTTGDEELLGQGLALNDNLQNLLAKHDAIASGSPLPIEAAESTARASTSLTPAPEDRSHCEDENEEDDDEFAQLARRSSKIRPATGQSPSAETDDQEHTGNSGSLALASSSASVLDSSSSISSTALTLPDPPAPVRTAAKQQDIIDFLSITLSTNTSSPHTPLTPPAANHSGSPLSVSSSGQGYTENPQPYIANQGYVPYNSYVAPWAQPALPQPQPQFYSPPPPQPQSQAPLYSSSFPPPPWIGQPSASPNPFLSPAYQFPEARPSSSTYAPMSTSRPLQQYSSSSSQAYNAPATPEAQVNTNQRQAGSTAPKPFVPSYRLFEDLVELRNADGSLKVSGTPSSLQGTSGQSMIGGRK